jgi:DNA-binding transcriptional LysR family regulator
MEMLNDMALFVEVAKARSFRRAGEVLGMPNSTISRRVATLEKTLGLRLLHRTTRKIELTEAGQVYFERSRRIVEEARLVHEELGDMLQQPTGLLRVSLPVDFANTYLAPIIAEFAEKYPGINFDFDLTPRLVDLVTEPFDVAIRMGEPEVSQLVARPIARLSPHLFASPRYIEQHGEPERPEDLQNRTCLTMSRSKEWVLGDGTETIRVSVGGRFRLNGVGMIRRLSALGMGIAMLPDEVVIDELERGQLRRVLSGWRGEPTSVYAMTETRLLPAKTQRFIEFLRSRLRGYD